MVEFLNSLATLLTEMLRDLTGLLGNWPIGTILGILLAVCVISMVGLILYGLFIAIDSWFRPRKNGIGKVSAKFFTPAHDNIEYSVALRMPVVRHYPDDYSIVVQLEEGADSVSVRKSFYNGLQKNDPVDVEYVIGRLTGDVYLKAVYRAT